MEIFTRKGERILIDDEDYDLVKGYTWFVHRGYATSTTPDKRTILMHRMIMQTPKGMKTDHRDLDRLNNRRSNIRICTTAQNAYNRGANKKKVLPKCVYFDKESRRLYVRITFEGRDINLGRFETEVEAVAAYNKAVLKYHGEFAFLQ